MQDFEDFNELEELDALSESSVETIERLARESERQKIEIEALKKRVAELEHLLNAKNGSHAK